MPPPGSGTGASAGVIGAAWLAAAALESRRLILPSEDGRFEYLPVKNIAEMVAYSQSKPDQLNYGSSGIGFAFGGERDRYDTPLAAA